MPEVYVYITSNQTQSTLYVGATNNIERRMFEHKCLIGAKFPAKYHITQLLYFEALSSMPAALLREKQLKNWHRNWKMNLIKETNPNFTDLAKDWFPPDQLELWKKELTKEQLSEQTKFLTIKWKQWSNESG